jgi:hypothetical protein
MREGLKCWWQFGSKQLDEKSLNREFTGKGNGDYTDKF